MQSTETKEVQRIINKFIKEKKTDLTKMVYRGTVTEWSEKTGFTPSQIYHALSNIRSQTGQLTKSENGLREVTLPYRDPGIMEVLINNHHGRGSPRHEKIACDILCYALLNILPKGGIALIIGTPTPISIAKAYYNMFCIDNYEVAIIVKHTTEYDTELIIGDTVNRAKALFKVQFWKALNSTNNFRVYMGKVDKHTYKKHIERLTVLYPLVKVILMTSGVWKGCKPTTYKYNLDCNFEEPSIELTSKYKGLHILAMTRGENKNMYNFPIRYLHDGKNIILKNNKNNPFETSAIPEID